MERLKIEEHLRNLFCLETISTTLFVRLVYPSSPIIEKQSMTESRRFFGIHQQFRISNGWLGNRMDFGKQSNGILQLYLDVIQFI